MSLKKLPPLPRKRKSSSGMPKTKRQSALTPLPPLPRRKREGEEGREDSTPSYPRLSASKVVEPLRGTKKWPQHGGIGVGRWFETTDFCSEWGGVCCQCKRTIAADDLTWMIGPFAQWEGWTCRDCRKHRHGARTSMRPQIERDTTSKVSLPDKQSDRERVYWLHRVVEIDVQRWEDEGGPSDEVAYIERYEWWRKKRG